MSRPTTRLAAQARPWPPVCVIASGPGLSALGLPTWFEGEKRGLNRPFAPLQRSKLLGSRTRNKKERARPRPPARAVASGPGPSALGPALARVVASGQPPRLSGLRHQSREGKGEALAERSSLSSAPPAQSLPRMVLSLPKWPGRQTFPARLGTQIKGSPHRAVANGPGLSALLKSGTLAAR